MLNSPRIIFELDPFGAKNTIRHTAGNEKLMRSKLTMYTNMWKYVSTGKFSVNK